jgi:23S rRNA maturation-related 3'-5' exoribonuclease YhaM
MFLKIILEGEDMVPNGSPRKRTISENKQLKKSTSRQISKQISKTGAIDEENDKEEEVGASNPLV